MCLDNAFMHQDEVKPLCSHHRTQMDKISQSATLDLLTKAVLVTKLSDTLDHSEEADIIQYQSNLWSKQC